jgi:YD repeat-containing protein
MLKQIIVTVLIGCLANLVHAQVRSTDELDPRNPSEAFYHANMGIPMNQLWNPTKIDTVFDANGKLIKRTYPEGTKTATETWAYYDDGTLKEYFYRIDTTVKWHETYNPQGYITEFYQHMDGPFPIHWFYKYSNFKLKKQKIFRKEIYNAASQIQAAQECDITSGTEKLLRIFKYRYDEQGRVKSETIRNADATPGEDWYYYYDDGDKDYKALMDPDMHEIRRVYLE